MKRRNREFSVFSISMLDVIASAMGAFLIIMVVLLPHYTTSRELQEENRKKQAELNECREEQRACQNKWEKCREEQKACQDKWEECKEKQPACEKKWEDCIKERDDYKKRLEEQALRLGFVMKGKKVIFIVDISGSMDKPHGKEDRITPVTSGIKMLLATMDESYETDIVFFPNVPQNSDYGWLWGRMQSVTEDRKYDAYRFLSNLKAKGSTPTESVLNVVLDRSEYQEAGTIFLLSDGVPSEGSRALGRNELKKLLGRISDKNERKRKEKIINTIGVGDDFRNRNSQSDAVWFLRELADRNQGFYAGY